MDSLSRDAEDNIGAHSRSRSNPRNLAAYLHQEVTARGVRFRIQGSPTATRLKARSQPKVVATA